MDDLCTAIPTPVRRRLALGRLGFTWDRQAGGYRRGELVIDEETLDAMTDEDFHHRLHALAGEEVCMANQVVAAMTFGYGPPAPGVTRTVERGEIFELAGYANDALLEARGYVRRLPEGCPVERCPVCGLAFVEGLPEHMARRHGPQEAA
jgi:hypothetical protein